MYISKVVSNYIYFLRYLRLFKVFNLSGKCPLWDASSQGNICRAFVWSGKCPSGMCLVGEMSVGHLSGRGNARWGCVWSGKCPSWMCLVGEGSVGDVSGRGSVHRGCVWSGKCLSGKSLSGKSPSRKRPSGMCPEIELKYVKVVPCFLSLQNLQYHKGLQLYS